MKRTTSKKASAKLPIKTLFLDIGGVLLTNGWDHHSRDLAAQTFKLDPAEFQHRHHLTFDTYENGKLTLKEYLSRVVFYEKRSFTRTQFERFMFEQSQPFPEMLDMMAQLKKRYGLKIIVVSNEGRELNMYRIKKFKLERLVDSFVSSSFVHIRKPDTDIFQLAIDMAQTPVKQTVYIENTAMMVQVAESMGIPSILHTSYESTRDQLAGFGLKMH